MTVDSTHDPYGLHRHDDQGRELVACDGYNCIALQEPQTLEEYKVALDHWENHSWLHGCSHGD